MAKTILKKPSAEEYKDIVSTIGFTRRRIEQRFLESTGLSMGAFVRKNRFQNAINILNSRLSWSLTRIGLEAGYYDQSHFIREFKGYSGLTPKRFLLEQEETKGDVATLMTCANYP